MSGFTSLENGADAEQLQHDNDSKSDDEATTRAELDVFYEKNTNRWNGGQHDKMHTGSQREQTGANGSGLSHTVNQREWAFSYREPTGAGFLIPGASVSQREPTGT